jgi:putative ABC transport system permease protein
MTRDPHAPPAAAAWLLETLIASPLLRESILGDLYEEYSARGGRSRLRAACWYWTHSTRIIARLMITAALSRRQPPARVAPPATRGDSLMRTLGLEIRHSIRAIVKRPALAGILILTLALGLGANAAIFALVDALVLRPFTMPDVDRIVMVTHTRDDGEYKQETVSPADFIDFKKQMTDVFERFAAFDWWDANIVGRDEPEAVTGFRVSADFFPALGVQPALGRNFLPDEEIHGRHERVILGYGLWQRRFAGDPAIVGSSVQIEGTPYEVVGIAPSGFNFPNGAEIWGALSFDAKTAELRRNRYLTGIARLAPGKTLDDAQAQMAVISQRLEGQYPDTNRGFHAKVYTLAQGMLDIGLGPILSLWQASAIFVLLIACANVANLLLARGAERQREMAVRLAIGASSARVVRELLIESVLIALASVPAALAVAWIGLKVLRDAMPAKIQRFVAGWQNIDVDLRLFLFTAALAVATAIVFGLVPAIQATRSRLAESLKEGGRSATSGGGRLRLRRGLVIAELALALPLLVACGLSAISVQRFLNGPQGFNPDGLLTMQVSLAETKYPDEETRRRFVERAVQQLRALPGAQSVTAINIMPSIGGNSGRPVEIEGKPNPDPANPPSVDYRSAIPSVFETFEIPILRGRGFTDGDRAGTQPVAIVTDSLARQYWPNEDPLGRRLRLNNTGPWLTVIGVSGDVIHNWFGRRNYPTVYRPLDQAPPGRFALLIRTAGNPQAMTADVRTAMRTVDPVQPIYELITMRETLKDRTLGLRYIAAIMVVFGGIALLLAVVGVYGVMAFMVTQRTHEIGVRMALGATRQDVLRLTVGHAGRLTAIGAGLGVLLSLALSRLIEAGLLGVIASDVRVVAGFAAVLTGAALAAGYIPARRAATINPMVALRAE